MKDLESKEVSAGGEPKGGNLQNTDQAHVGRSDAETQPLAAMATDAPSIREYLVEGLKMEEGASEPDWWTEAAQDVIRHAKTDSSPDWRNAIVGGLLRAYNRGKDAAAQHLKREQEPVRCNRCQANLCEHDNCTDWTCARACSICAEGPREPNAELTAARAAVALHGVNLTKANVAGYEKGFKAAQEYETAAAQPPQELVGLPAKWRKQAEESLLESSRIRRTVGHSTEAETNCVVRAELWKRNADELEAALTRVGGGRHGMSDMHKMSGAEKRGLIPDESSGDVIAAETDGTIVLDDDITTWNPRRAQEFLESKQLRADQVVALRGPDGEWEYDRIVELVDDGTARLALNDGRRKLKTLRALRPHEVGPSADRLADAFERVTAEAALRAETPAPLLHKASTHKPSGCYCPPNDCQAPKIMGRQVPCSRPCETYTEMCKPGSSVKLRYYCVLPKNHTKPHAFHATAQQARAETPAPREALSKLLSEANYWHNCAETKATSFENATPWDILHYCAGIVESAAGEPEQAK